LVGHFTCLLKANVFDVDVANEHSFLTYTDLVFL
jgi:hypothetical protein